MTVRNEKVRRWGGLQWHYANTKFLENLSVVKNLNWDKKRDRHTDAHKQHYYPIGLLFLKREKETERTSNFYSSCIIFTVHCINTVNC